jgi:hypothetical protein
MLANSSEDTFEAQHGVEYDANLSWFQLGR